MRYIYFIHFSIVFVIAGYSVSANANANNAVCLAAIAHVNHWSDEPGPNQSQYGRYLGRFGIAYGFQSYDTKYQYYCRITGTKIEISDTHKPWKVKAGVRYRYRREGPELIITSAQQGAASVSSRFEMREVLGRIKEMEAGTQ